MTKASIHELTPLSTTWTIRILNTLFTNKGFKHLE